jgi:hypothetical protein
VGPRESLDRWRKSRPYQDSINTPSRHSKLLYRHSYPTSPGYVGICNICTCYLLIGGKLSKINVPDDSAVFCLCDHIMCGTILQYTGNF